MTHGGAPAGWLEFSANVNPTGTPAVVAAAVAAARYDRYADLDPTAAEAHLAADAGVPADSVLLTAGATEAIRLVVSAFLAGGGAAIVGPTYSEYERLARQTGSAIDITHADPPLFDPPIERAIAGLPSGARALFLCDPNNPTGRALVRERLRELIASVPRDVTLIIDQSFAPFASPTISASECVSAGSVVLVRSLTKTLAVPGLRLGYVISRPDIVAALRALQDPWSVAAHAVAAARVSSWSLPQDVRETVVAWRERLADALAGQGLHAVPSETNFLLVHAGAGTAALVAALADRRIALRSCASFGLPEHVRVAVRPPAEQDALLGALAAIRGCAQ